MVNAFIEYPHKNIYTLSFLSVREGVFDLHTDLHFSFYYVFFDTILPHNDFENKKRKSLKTAILRCFETFFFWRAGRDSNP